MAVSRLVDATVTLFSFYKFSMSDEELSCHDLYRQQRESKRQRRGSAAVASRPPVRRVRTLAPPRFFPAAVPVPGDEFGRLHVLKQVLSDPAACAPVVALAPSGASLAPSGLAAASEFPPLSEVVALAPAPAVAPAPAAALDVLLEVLGSEESTPVTPTNSATAISSTALVTPEVVNRMMVSPETPNRMSVFSKKFQPNALEKMFGQDRAIRALVQWYQTGQWNKQPFVLWGPCGVGKTLMCNLLAARHGATFVAYEDEFDAPDKLKGWIQSVSGVLAFSDSAPTNTWMLLDDFDSLESQCRTTLMGFIKKMLNKQLPGPLILTCSNLHDKNMAALKALPHSVQLSLHTLQNLQRLARTVDSKLSPDLVAQLASWACGDARRLLNEARFASITHQQTRVAPVVAPEPKLYHSPFAAAQALVSKPEIHSRALDGQEFLVQQLLYQNYPACATSLDAMAATADALGEFDLLDTLHEFPEYTKTYLTFVVPSRMQKPRHVPNFRLNPQHMRQTFDQKKRSLDWHCLQKC